MKRKLLLRLPEVAEAIGGNRVLAGAVALVAVAATTGGAVVASGAGEAAPTAGSPANTAKVERGTLSDMVSLEGTLTYRARPDGSPHSVINQARGIYTELPDVGDEVGCGDVLYRVNDKPVLMLCGTVPAYRDLGLGDHGNDVRQLNRNLHELGYDDDAPVDPDEREFTPQTQTALKRLRAAKGFQAAGALDIDDVGFLPRPARISAVTAGPGGVAQPGAEIAQATSDTLEVQVVLEASQQGDVKVGDRAQITLPGNRPVAGRVYRLGRVAQVPAEAEGGTEDAAGGEASAGVATAADPTLQAYIELDKPKAARGLDSAPVQVDITTRGLKNVLSVPVTAIVGRSGGGFAVEVVRDGGQPELVSVELGLFDTGGGRVQVEGDLRQGDDVVVPPE